VAQLLTVSPRKRVSASEALKHRWIAAADADTPLTLPSIAHLSRIRAAGRLKKVRASEGARVRARVSVPTLPQPRRRPAGEGAEAVAGSPRETLP
jgi:hypothetical protein